MSTPQLSRRGMLRATAGTGLLAVAGIPALGASDFWNKKASSEWSEDEILQLRTKSPWAKKVHLETGGGRGGGGGRGESGGMGASDGGGSGGGGGGRGGGGSRGIRPGEPNPSPGSGFGGGVDVIVRWENAEPLMQATKLKRPAALENHYCISVTGLPPQMLMMLVNGGGRGRAAEATPEDPAVRQKAAIDRLLHSATLTVKGKDPQSPDSVMQTADKQSLIFGFPKPNLPLTAADKEIQFTMNPGMSPIKAKFEPKEMMFKGEFTV